MPTLRVDSIGDYIRDQRRNARISLRQLADLAGVSNPYLSQIERGLRHPSAEILQQIAKGLRISAETLYVRAGILDERSSSPEVTAAIHGDHGLTERQKRVLIDIYETFWQENSTAADAAATVAAAATAAASAAASAAADVVDAVGADLRGQSAASDANGNDVNGNVAKGSAVNGNASESRRSAGPRGAKRGAGSRVSTRTASAAPTRTRTTRSGARAAASSEPTSVRRSHPKT